MTMTRERCGTSRASLMASRLHVGHLSHQLAGDLTKTLPLGSWKVLSLFINLVRVTVHVADLDKPEATRRTGSARSEAI
jgi:hypothetical protein